MGSANSNGISRPSIEAIERSHEIAIEQNDQLIAHTKDLMRACRELGMESVKVGNIEIKAYPMAMITLPQPGEVDKNTAPLDPSLAQQTLEDEELLYMSS